MTPKQLEKIVHHEPFIPYRLRLEDGEEVIVRRPRKSSVAGDTVALVGICKKTSRSRGVERFRAIRVEQILSAEYLEKVP